MYSDIPWSKYSFTFFHHVVIDLGINGYIIINYKPSNEGFVWLVISPLFWARHHHYSHSVPSTVFYNDSLPFTLFLKDISCFLAVHPPKSIFTSCCSATNITHIMIQIIQICVCPDQDVNRAWAMQPHA